MEIEVEYEDEREIECPHCHKTSKHIIRGITYADIEPPERDEP